MADFIKQIVPLFALVVVSMSCSVKEPKTSIDLQDLTRHVDPFIGSGFHGHVFVGANVPFGAVQLGPTQITSGWDWCSGYHYSDSVIAGFAHTHLSGTGIGDLGDILFMPTTGGLFVEKGKPGNFANGYSALFSHNDEVARPGYYKVELPKYKVKVELTTTTRVGMHKYTFSTNDTARVVIDLAEGIGWDGPTLAHIHRLNDSTIVGYRYSKGWANDQRIFFAAVFSKSMSGFSVYGQNKLVVGDSLSARYVKGIVDFPVDQGEALQVKVGISPVSIENAVMNINRELSHWDFDQVVKDASDLWNRELNKIQIETNSEKEKRIFYTAMYHTMIAPSVFNDSNGDYRGTDKKVYNDTTFTNLTTFSLWDTYRATHPLYTLIQQERVPDMINSMLRIYQQQGQLPVWHLMGNETFTMPGNSALPVVADAYLKGFNGFDKALAYEAMKKTTLADDRGLKSFREYGYIPADEEAESVASGLEYSIDDWGLAQVAKVTGRDDDYAMFSKRAQSYKNYFDHQTRFMRGRISQNEWREPFSPLISRHRKDDFAEGNAWQYTWLVPQDVEGLIELLGGDQRFTQKLDSLFVIEGDMGEEASNDITGLIGQYAHGNEPSHHIPYLYGYAGQPHKTAAKVRYILDSLYDDTPAGLCGNEDVGQMSSWYILSSLGFYPVNPSNGAFVFGSPLFKKAVIRLPQDKTFTIVTKGNSESNIYIQDMTLNGKPYSKAYLLYRDIVAGGELVITMGDKPSTWATSKEDWARSVVH